MKTKKYAFYGPFLLTTALLLSACGEKEEVKNGPTGEQAESEFGFRSFDLNIDTADQKDAIDVSFDVDVSETEAEYLNKLESLNLSGDKAYKKLEPLFKELALTKDMSKEEVIEKVAKAFGVEEYKEFDLEVEFSDGDDQEFKDNK
ncbi:YusW family protein [Paenisporosarcina sp. FSL H8-0542]|uniref:YusW family protein n=1 Tax=Paenisporosarcina sp. FSL H8-0542 TaxID=2921401 RepID=UPI00315B2024